MKDLSILSKLYILIIFSAPPASKLICNIGIALKINAFRSALRHIASEAFFEQDLYSS